MTTTERVMEATHHSYANYAAIREQRDRFHTKRRADEAAKRGVEPAPYPPPPPVRPPGYQWPLALPIYGTFERGKTLHSINFCIRVRDQVNNGVAGFEGFTLAQVWLTTEHAIAAALAWLKRELATAVQAGTAAATRLALPPPPPPKKRK